LELTGLAKADMALARLSVVDVAKVAHALAKAIPSWCVLVAENSDPRELCGLLRKRGERRREKTTRDAADERSPIRH
jgi:hypothetical protein